MSEWSHQKNWPAGPKKGFWTKGPPQHKFLLFYLISFCCLNSFFLVKWRKTHILCFHIFLIRVSSCLLLSWNSYDENAVDPFLSVAVHVRVCVLRWWVQHINLVPAEIPHAHISLTNGFQCLESSESVRVNSKRVNNVEWRIKRERSIIDNMRCWARICWWYEIVSNSNERCLENVLVQDLLEPEDLLSYQRLR